MIETGTTDSIKKRLEKHEYALGQVVDDNDSLIEKAALTVAYIPQDQTTDGYCRKATKIVDTANADYTIDNNGQLIRAAPINSADKILDPQAFRESFLCYSYRPIVAGHPGQHRECDSMQREFF